MPRPLHGSSTTWPLVWSGYLFFVVSKRNTATLGGRLNMKNTHGTRCRPPREGPRKVAQLDTGSRSTELPSPASGLFLVLRFRKLLKLNQNMGASSCVSAKMAQFSFWLPFRNRQKPRGTSKSAHPLGKAPRSSLTDRSRLSWLAASPRPETKRPPPCGSKNRNSKLEPW